MKAAKVERLLLPVVGSVTLLLLVSETLFPLRPRVAPRGPRTLRNLGLATLAGASAMQLVMPALLCIARLGEQRRFGVLPALGLPRGLTSLAGVMLLDLGIYGWHRLNHRLRLLWRFHRVHHADLDLDVSTSFRFHPGEVISSVTVRGLQVALIGPSPALLVSYELLLQVASAFHHANLRLSPRLERNLAPWLVTPAQHGIHHSSVASERNCNFAVLFSVWDRLFGSASPSLARQPAKLGLKWPREVGMLGLSSLLTLPFRTRRALLAEEVLHEAE